MSKLHVDVLPVPFPGSMAETVMTPERLAVGDRPRGGESPDACVRSARGESRAVRAR